MPVLSGLPPSAASMWKHTVEWVGDMMEFFEVPALHEFVEAFRLAYGDVIVASKSTGRFLRIALRPLMILAIVLLKHLGMLSRVVAKHTVRHAYVWGKELVYQMKTASVEFINFQRSLPRFWIIVEVGCIAVTIALVLLRRFIRRRRYVERIQRWYCDKKRSAQRKYDKVVRRISETSVTLALILPHCLYLLVWVGVKMLLPSVLRYVVSRTYITELVSLWHPAYLTVGFISGDRSAKKKEKKASVDNDNTTKTTPTPKNSSPVKTRTGGKVADRWLQATQDPKSPENIKQSSSLSSFGSNNSTSKSTSTSKRSSNTNTDGNDDFVASQLLKYWIVYGLIHSLIRSVFLMPFVGSLISRTTTASPATTSSKSFFSRQKTMGFLAGRFSSAPMVFLELKLILFVWLRFVNANANAPETNDKYRSEKSLPASSPVHFMYNHLAPLALHLSDSAASATSTSQQIAQNKFSLRSIGTKLASLLDLAVMVRLISEGTKNTIVNFTSESFSLLPACVTLFMPSLFASIGCVYVSAILPAANSARCHECLRRFLRGSTEYAQARSDRLRYLKYWVLYSLMSLLIDNVLATTLAWIPLSTHLTLLVWIWLNLAGTNFVYKHLEYELVAFGLIKKSKKTMGDKDGDSSTETDDYYKLEDTMTVRLLTKLSSTIPRAASLPESQDDDGKTENDKTDGGGGGDSNVQGDTEKTKSKDDETIVTASKVELDKDNEAIVTPAPAPAPSPTPTPTQTPPLSNENMVTFNTKPVVVETEQDSKDVDGDIIMSMVSEDLNETENVTEEVIKTDETMNKE